MLASVMYNLDIRFVPVYCSGCMFVLFLYRVCIIRVITKSPKNQIRSILD